MMVKKKNSHNNNAVSEVIGTVLLLGISVTLFSIVYISVLTLPNSPPTPSSNIYFSYNYNETNDVTNIILTHFGGTELSLDTDIKIIIGDDSPIIEKVRKNLSEESINDSYWGFGEQYIYNASGNLLDKSIEVSVIDTDSNSIVSIGRKIQLSNRAPVISSPTPSNGAYSVPISTFELRIDILDPDADTIDWYIETIPNIGSKSRTGESDGTKICNITGLAENTTYTWYVNATDPTGGGTWTKRTYTFTTGLVGVNSSPTFGAPSPTNGSTGWPLNFTWSIPISDLDNDAFNWTIECNNSQNSSANWDVDGTKNLSLSGLVYNTAYTVWVNATDPTGSGNWTNRTYSFTTRPNEIVYNFSIGAGTSHHAYGTQTSKWADDVNENRNAVSDVFLSTAYDQIAHSDNSRYISVPSTGNMESTVIYEFNISEDAADVTQLDVLWEGYGEGNESIELYIWNYNQGNWGDLSGNIGEDNFIQNDVGSNDIILQGSTTTNINHYINTEGEITILIYMDASGENSHHDYISITITI
jgi:FlaG/FlaF family flagellin (archaellin)